MTNGLLDRGGREDGNQNQIKKLVKTGSRGVVWLAQSRTTRLPKTNGAIVRQGVVEPVTRKVNGRAVPLGSDVRAVGRPVSSQ